MLEHYDWWEADDEIKAAVAELKAAQAEAREAVRAFGEEMGAVSAFNRGPAITGLHFPDGPPDGWRVVYHVEGKPLSRPYQRSKEGKRIGKRMRALRVPDMGDFSAKFGGTQMMEPGPSGGFYVRGPVFRQIGERIFYGEPVGYEHPVKNKSAMRPVKRSEVMAAEEAAEEALA